MISGFCLLISTCLNNHQTRSTCCDVLVLDFPGKEISVFGCSILYLITVYPR